MNIFYILKGWYRFLFAKRSQMAKDRLTICFQCTQRRGIFCGVCHCELHAKAEVEEEECPRGLWPIGKQFGDEWVGKIMEENARKIKS